MSTQRLPTEVMCIVLGDWRAALASKGMVEQERLPFAAFVVRAKYGARGHTRKAVGTIARLQVSRPCKEYQAWIRDWGFSLSLSPECVPSGGDAKEGTVQATSV